MSTSSSTAHRYSHKKEPQDEDKTQRQGTYKVEMPETLIQRRHGCSLPPLVVLSPAPTPLVCPLLFMPPSFLSKPSPSFLCCLDIDQQAVGGEAGGRRGPQRVHLLPTLHGGRLQTTIPKGTAGITCVLYYGIDLRPLGHAQQDGLASDPLSSLSCVSVDWLDR